MESIQHLLQASVAHCRRASSTQVVFHLSMRLLTEHSRRVCIDFIFAAFVNCLLGPHSGELFAARQKGGFALTG
jgi:hypothetical protein